MLMAEVVTAGQSVRLQNLQKKHMLIPLIGTSTDLNFCQFLGGDMQRSMKTESYKEKQITGHIPEPLKTIWKTSDFDGSITCWYFL